jgi:regulator of sigma E protease
MIITLLYFLLILGVIVVVHEFGHFFFARKFGVKAYEFSIGMGPKLWGTKPKKKDATPLNIRAIPIGGYVALAGEEADDDDKTVPKNQKLYSKPIWQRFLIMFFGAGNNFILAFIVLFFLALITGAPDMTPQVKKLDESYPMYEAGMRENDIITKINGHSISTIDDVQVYLIMASTNKESTFEVKRKDEKKTIKVTPKEEKDKDGNVSYKFGIVFDQGRNSGIIAAVKYAFIKIGALCKQMVIVLVNLVTGHLSLNNLSGPVGIYSVVGEARSTGIVNIFYLMALLSVNIGFINLIPLPAFDGGRIFFLFIEAIKGSPVSPKVENTIHNIGFFILMGLMIVITLNDIIKLF